MFLPPTPRCLSACGGKDRFRLDDKEGRGTWFCNQCGNGDGLDLVRLVTGRSVKEVAGMVSEVLALPEVQDKPLCQPGKRWREKRPEQTAIRNLKSCLKTVNQLSDRKGIAGLLFTASYCCHKSGGDDFSSRVAAAAFN